MGQDLLNPPSVEGWHTGKEWIDTGCLVERINFAAQQVKDVSKPGVRLIIDRLRRQPAVARGVRRYVSRSRRAADRISGNTRRAAPLCALGRRAAFGSADEERTSAQRVSELLPSSGFAGISVELKTVLRMSDE